jgi:hypothetical protein
VLRYTQVLSTRTPLILEALIGMQSKFDGQYDFEIAVSRNAAFRTKSRNRRLQDLREFSAERYFQRINDYE